MLEPGVDDLINGGEKRVVVIEPSLNLPKVLGRRVHSRGHELGDGLASTCDQNRLPFLGDTPYEIGELLLGLGNTQLGHNQPRSFPAFIILGLTGSPPPPPAPSPGPDAPARRSPAARARPGRRRERPPARA